jgi:ectoine utilization protein EutC
MIIFKESEIRQHVGINQEAISVVEKGFSSLAAGNVELPPIMRVDIAEAHGEVDVKTAYIRGLDKFAIKISSGFFNNSKLGLPSLSGMMMLISTETGIPQSVLLDNGFLTDVRTACAGAIAAKYLARKNLDTVGVIGSGAQARYQMIALKQVRNFRRILVYSPSTERAQKYAKEMENLLEVPVVVAPNAETVVRESDLVVTTTPAKDPVIKSEWLHPGLHITAMGSDAEHKQELEAAILKKADLLVCDVKSQCIRLGELHHAWDQRIITDLKSILELGEITSGQKAGRTNQSQITVCDLTGTGVQDTAIAVYAYNELKSRELGIQID